MLRDSDVEALRTTVDCKNKETMSSCISIDIFSNKEEGKHLFFLMYALRENKTDEFLNENFSDKLIYQMITHVLKNLDNLDNGSSKLKSLDLPRFVSIGN